MTEEADIIQHLLEIESEASEMLLSAQKEADEKVAKARAVSESQFKERYGKITASLEAEENQSKETIQKTHQKEIEDYKKSLDSISKDNDAFNALLAELLA